MSEELKDKTIILGVTGGISAYKACELSRMMMKEGAEVKVVMTENAKKFVSPLTFQYLTGNKVADDMYDLEESGISHIELADENDLIVICPATANFISKYANGIADNLLLNVLLASKSQIVLCPAMNVNMYENTLIQNNLNKLVKNGVHVVDPDSGELACGWIGKGRLANLDTIVETIKKKVQNKSLEKENILITAGATREYMDPVRFISNPSTGIVGYCMAEEFQSKGAKVNIIAGYNEVNFEKFDSYKKITTAEEMKNEISKNLNKYTVVIKAAAVGDYRFSKRVNKKIKKTDGVLKMELEENIDVLKYIGENKKENQIVVGFAAETEKIVENAKKKIISKNLDLIVANDISKKNSGFGENSNFSFLIDSSGNIDELGLISKSELARTLATKIEQMRQNS